LKLTKQKVEKILGLFFAAKKSFFIFITMKCEIVSELFC